VLNSCSQYIIEDNIKCLSMVTQQHKMTCNGDEATGEPAGELAGGQN
jgi:hypothetical protein